MERYFLDKILKKGDNFFTNFFKKFNLYDIYDKKFDVNFTGLFAQLEDKIRLYYVDDYGKQSFLDIDDFYGIYYYPTTTSEFDGQTCNTAISPVSNHLQNYLAKNLDTVEPGLSNQYIEIAKQKIDESTKKTVEKIKGSKLIPPINPEEVEAKIDFLLELRDMFYCGEEYRFFSELKLDIINNFILPLSLEAVSWNTKKGVKLMYTDINGTAYYIYATDYKATFYQSVYDEVENRTKFKTTDISENWREQFGLNLTNYGITSEEYHTYYNSAVDKQKQIIIDRKLRNAEKNKKCLYT